MQYERLPPAEMLSVSSLVSLRESNAFRRCRRWSLLFKGTVQSMQKRFFWPVCVSTRSTNTVLARREMPWHRDRRRCTWRLHSTLRNAQRCDDETAQRRHAFLRGVHPVVCLCLQVLLKYEADIEVKNAKAETPLHIAATKGSLTIAKVLLPNASRPSTFHSACDTLSTGVAMESRS